MFGCWYNFRIFMHGLSVQCLDVDAMFGCWYNDQVLMQCSGVDAMFGHWCNIWVLQQYSGVDAMCRWWFNDWFFIQCSGVRMELVYSGSIGRQGSPVQGVVAVEGFKPNWFSEETSGNWHLWRQCKEDEAGHFHQQRYSSSKCISWISWNPHCCKFQRMPATRNPSKLTYFS